MQSIDKKGPFLLVILGLAGLMASIVIGKRAGFLGYALGFPIGAAVMLSILCVAFLTWITIQNILFRGVPWLPTCRNGCCRGGPLADPGDYKPVWDDRWTVQGFRCRCGFTYKKVGRQFVEISPDGSSRPYLIWSWLKGWLPDQVTVR